MADPRQGIRIRPAEPSDRSAFEGFAQRWSAVRVARLGTLEDTRDHAALLAEDADRLTGILSYAVRGSECEVLAFYVDERGRGIGTALLAAARAVAARAGCSRLWLVTTNDNLDALRFYQRRGFRLVAVHRGAVDHSRAHLKPEIPETGAYGIPLRDEIELELAVRPDAEGSPKT